MLLVQSYNNRYLNKLRLPRHLCLHTAVLELKRFRRRVLRLINWAELFFLFYSRTRFEGCAFKNSNFYYSSISENRSVYEALQNN